MIKKISFVNHKLLTQEWYGLQHGTDLVHRSLGLAAFVDVTTITVHPLQ